MNQMAIAGIKGDELTSDGRKKREKYIDRQIDTLYKMQPAIIE